MHTRSSKSETSKDSKDIKKKVRRFQFGTRGALAVLTAMTGAVALAKKRYDQLKPNYVYVTTLDGKETYVPVDHTDNAMASDHVAKAIAILSAAHDDSDITTITKRIDTAVLQPFPSGAIFVKPAKPLDYLDWEGNIQHNQKREVDFFVEGLTRRSAEEDLEVKHINAFKKIISRKVKFCYMV